MGRALTLEEGPRPDSGVPQAPIGGEEVGRPGSRGRKKPGVMRVWETDLGAVGFRLEMRHEGKKHRKRGFTVCFPLRQLNRGGGRSLFHQ